jgi:hypothetical protein
MLRPHISQANGILIPVPFKKEPGFFSVTGESKKASDKKRD